MRSCLQCVALLIVGLIPAQGAVPEERAGELKRDCSKEADVDSSIEASSFAATMVCEPEGYRSDYGDLDGMQIWAIKCSIKEVFKGGPAKRSTVRLYVDVLPPLGDETQHVGEAGAAEDLYEELARVERKAAERACTEATGPPERKGRQDELIKRIRSATDYRVDEAALIAIGPSSGRGWSKSFLLRFGEPYLFVLDDRPDKDKETTSGEDYYRRVEVNVFEAEWAAALGDGIRKRIGETSGHLGSDKGQSVNCLRGCH